MGWVRLDDAFYDHPKFIEVGPCAGWLWMSSLAWSNRNLTDGFIPFAQVPRLASFDGLSFITESNGIFGDEESVEHGSLALTLISLRLWDEVEGGYQIHDFHDYQPSAAEVRAKREKEKARWATRTRRVANHSTPDSTVDSALDSAATPPASQSQGTDPLDQCAESAVTLRAVPDEPDELPLKAELGLSYAKTVAGYLLRHGFSLDSEGGKLRPSSYRLIVSHVDHALGDGHPKRTWALLRLVADYVEAMTGTEVTREAQSHLGRLVKSYGASAALYGMEQAVTWGAGIGKSYEDDPLAITKYATSVCAKAAS